MLHHTIAMGKAFAPCFFLYTVNSYSQCIICTVYEGIQDNKENHNYSYRAHVLQKKILKKC